MKNTSGNIRSRAEAEKNEQFQKIGYLEGPIWTNCCSIPLAKGVARYAARCALCSYLFFLWLLFRRWAMNEAHTLVRKQEKDIVVLCRIIYKSTLDIPFALARARKKDSTILCTTSIVPHISLKKWMACMIWLFNLRNINAQKTKKEVPKKGS